MYNIIVILGYYGTRKPPLKKQKKKKCYNYTRYTYMKCADYIAVYTLCILYTSRRYMFRFTPLLYVWSENLIFILRRVSIQYGWFSYYYFSRFFRNAIILVTVQYSIRSIIKRRKFGYIVQFYNSLRDDWNVRTHKAGKYVSERTNNVQFPVCVIL